MRGRRKISRRDSSEIKMELSEVGRNLLQILKEHERFLDEAERKGLAELISRYDEIAGMEEYVRSLATEIGAQVPLDLDPDLSLQWSLVDLMTTDFQGYPSATEIISMSLGDFLEWFPGSEEYDTRVNV